MFHILVNIKTNSKFGMVTESKIWVAEFLKLFFDVISIPELLKKRFFFIIKMFHILVKIKIDSKFGLVTESKIRVAIFF